MDFFNKLGKKASETYKITKEKATNISEELKIRGKVSDSKDRIKDLYNEIGEIVYSEIKSGTNVSKEDIIGKCDEITKLYENIARLENELLALKKIKKCIKCGANVDLKSEYCPKCGEKQPMAENIEVKEEPVEVKEAEVVEVKNAEESSKDDEVNLEN